MDAPRYLITGGAGFIGSNLARRLTSEGVSVRIADNFSTGRRENLRDLPGAEIVSCDLVSDPLEEILRGVTVIFHLAAVPSVPRSVEQPMLSHEASATATLRLLIAARDAGVARFINSSSSSVYGGVGEPPMRETSPTVPRSPYAVAKLAAEGYTRVFAAIFGMETVSLRYFNVFGPRQDPDSPYAAVIPRFITSYINGVRPRIFGDGRQSRDFTYVENVVEANLLAAKADRLAGEVVNIGAAQPRSILELLDAIAEIFGTRLDPVFEAERPGDIRASHADVAAAQKLLGYRPRLTFEDGLRRTVDYLRAAVESPA